MTDPDLVEFLHQAHLSGYAAGAGVERRVSPTGEVTVSFESGSRRFEDSYFGGEPYGGRAIALRDGRPEWIGVYYGRVISAGVDVQAVYDFLRLALNAAPADRAFRGPDHFQDGEWRYRCAWSGELDDFSGREWIDLADREVYRATFSGGLVDQRAGD